LLYFSSTEVQKQLNNKYYNFRYVGYVTKKKTTACYAAMLMLAIMAVSMV